jgi:hypothetical protein
MEQTSTNTGHGAISLLASYWMRGSNLECDSRHVPVRTTVKLHIRRSEVRLSDILVFKYCFFRDWWLVVFSVIHNLELISSAMDGNFQPGFLNFSSEETFSCVNNACRLPVLVPRLHLLRLHTHPEYSIVRTTVTRCFK